MTQSRSSLVLFLGMLVGVLWVLDGVLAREDVDVQGISPGMAQSDVRRRLGPPRHMARQILYRRYLEQWVYEAPRNLRIEFDCPRGQPARVLHVHALPAHP